MSGKDAGISLAAALDLPSSPQLELVVSALSSGAELSVTVSPVGAASKEKMASFTKPGRYEIPLDVKDPKVELRVCLEGPAGASASLESLAIQPKAPPAPVQISPANEFKMTDIAASFAWGAVDRCTRYEMEMAREPDFSDAKKIAKETLWGRSVYVPEELPEPGKMFWRVRAINHEGRVGEWSQTRTVQINNDHTASPLAWELSADKPLFVIEAYKLKDLSHYVNTIPEDLKPYCAIKLGWEYPHADEFARLAEKHNLRLMCWESESLAEIERGFQQCPQLLGAIVGEKMWGLTDKKNRERFDPNNPPKDYTALWDFDGNTTPIFQNHILPFMRAVVHQKLVPTKQEVLDNIRVAVEETKIRANVKHDRKFGDYEALYKATYGVREQGEVYELIPNTGRYYFIPVLPAGRKIEDPGILTLRLDEIKEVEATRRLFNERYPEWYKGDAWACHVGNTLIVSSSHENKDIVESYQIPFQKGAIRSISGQVGPHMYILGKFKENGDALWLQVNTSYPGRETVMEFECAGEPSVEVAPQSALIAAEKLAGNKLRLRLSHKEGAVEATVRGKK